MHEALLKTNQIIEYLKGQFEIDAAKQQAVYEGVLNILNVQQEEQKPKGAATIVGDNSPLENFPSHEENITS